MAKIYEKFVVSVKGVVTAVVGYTSSTFFTPQSEMCYDAHSPVYNGGQCSRLEITIESHPVVKKILFDGLPNIEKDDIICAYVFKAEEPENIRLMREIHNLVSLPIEKRILPRYVLRDFKPEEQAMKIEKLRRKVLSDIVEGDDSIYSVVATYINIDLSKILND